MSYRNRRSKILVLSWSDLSKDARVSRQVEALSECYVVDTLSYRGCDRASGQAFIISDAPLLGITRLIRRIWLLTREFEKYYWSQPAVIEALKLLHHTDYDLIVANDIDTLPLALKFASANRAPVFFDAHEFSPAEFEEKFIFRNFVRPYKNYLCKYYIHQAAAMTTVSPGLASRYQDDYSVEPAVVYNAPLYHPVARRPTNSGSMDAIRLVHHGVANPTRGLDQMIEAVINAGPRFRLDLYLIKTDANYFNRLIEYQRRCDRICIRPPVALNEIISTLSKYDVGLCVFPATSFNQKHCLPNKFFDFIQARLPIIVGPLPDMQQLTKNYNLGWVTDDCSSASITNLLKKIQPDDIITKHHGMERAAHELSYERSKDVMMGSISELFKLP
jgi:hypothetical protein